MKFRNFIIGAIGLTIAALAVFNPIVGPILFDMSAVAQTDPAPVATGTINVGASIYDLLIAYAAVVGTIVAGIVSWVQLKIKTKTGIDIDFGHRDAIETFVKNMAGRFLNRFDNLKGVDISVNSPLIAGFANEALNRIPDALNHFGLGPDDIKQRISDMIGRLTAPAAVATTTNVTVTAPPKTG